MQTVFTPPAVVTVPVVGRSETFPVHRIYCVGRNYEAHAVEMGGGGREAPFFFMKPADAVLVAQPGATTAMPYPPLTTNLHHEVELVVAIGKGGTNIRAEDAAQHIFGYAVGLDMTRRDMQAALKDKGRPWCIAKGFDTSAPIGPITPASQVPGIADAAIALQVNGEIRQNGNTAHMIWSVLDTIAQLSAAWTLQAGDLIYTGTPEGVGAVVRGDVMTATIDGLQGITVQVV
jgi:fumarylpyruvate hydrolase